MTYAFNDDKSKFQLGNIAKSNAAQLPVSLGGTGAGDASAARKNLEITPANIGAVRTDNDGYIRYVEGKSKSFRVGGKYEGASMFINYDPSGFGWWDIAGSKWIWHFNANQGGDTGWILHDSGKGSSGTVDYTLYRRKVGNVVFLRMNDESYVSAYSDSFRTIAALPDGWKPKYEVKNALGCISGNGLYIVQPNGNVGIWHTENSNYLWFNCAYPVG